LLEVIKGQKEVVVVEGDLEEEKDDENNVESEEMEEELEKSETQEESIPVLDNERWALYSLPDLDFSVEVPTYRLLQDLAGQDIYSYWEVRHADYPEDYLNLTWHGSVGDPFKGSIYITFTPSRIPEEVACGQGCVNEQVFNVYVYENEGGKSWSSIKDEYLASLEAICPSGGDECNQENSVVEKWDSDVLRVYISSPGGESNFYLLTNGRYIYCVSYYINSTIPESSQIAQKVLDSMKFE
jgi:hypothetical protein